MARITFPSFFTLLTLLVLATLLHPHHVLGNRIHDTMCGVSLKASDFPAVGSFGVIEGTWVMPTVSGGQGIEEGPRLEIGVSMCCGDDCLTQVRAGLWVWSDMYNFTVTPALIVQPHFYAVPSPHDHGNPFHILSGDIVTTRLEIKSSKTAKITISKAIHPLGSQTLEMDISLSTNAQGTPVLLIHERDNGQETNWIFPMPEEREGLTEPKFCGDVAWWYAYFQPDPDTETNPPYQPLHFSPVVLGGHYLATADGHEFPKNPTYSGMAYSWDALRVMRNGDSHTRCMVSDMANNGLTVMFEPHNWLLR